jgi:nucleotide-binding universal stress UspA family protein
MYANILLAIDLAHEKSWAKALPAAIDIARRYEAKLHLLSVVPDFGMTSVGAYFPPDFEKQAIARMREELGAFTKAHVPADVNAETHVAHGHPPEQILAAAGKAGADLIVMGSHAPDGALRSLFIGSNADRVVHASPVSVLVVRG